MPDISIVPKGKEYVPNHMNDKFTKGRITKLYSSKSGRIHYFLSKLSYNAFLYFESCGNVIDIREGFPLLDIEDTLTEDDKSLLEHYRNKETGNLYTLSTTFLLELSDGTFLARAVRYASSLNKVSVQRKLYLEECYFAYLGIDFKIITEKSMQNSHIKNMQNLRTIQSSNTINEVLNDINQSEFFSTIKKFNLPFSDFFEMQNIELTDGMDIVRHMIFNNHSRCNMSITLSTRTICSEFFEVTND